MSTPRFKKGDRVRRVNKTSPHGAPIGAEGTVNENHRCPWVNWDCGITDPNEEKHLEPITNTNTMNDELKVTKAAVLEAASKCSTAKATLQVLFPDAFKPSDEPFEFGSKHCIDLNTHGERPLMIGTTRAPHDLKLKCLILGYGWGMRQREHNGNTILTFHKKP